MAPSRYPGAPYVQARGFGGARTATQVVVIHATDNTASAQAEAAYAATRTDSVSAHFYIDDTSVYQSVPLDQIAWGCLYHGNHISVQLELCGVSSHISDATMRRAAPVVAWLLGQYGIPAVHYGPSQASTVANGARGVVGHDTVTAAFPQDNGDHTDPGTGFGWSTFMTYIQGGDDMLADDPDGVYLYNRVQALVHLNAEQGGPEHGTVPEVVTLLKRVDANAQLAATQPAPVALTQADRDAIVAALAAGLPTAAQIAKAVNDDAAARLAS